MGKRSVPDSRLGTVLFIYTESLKRVKGYSYGELVMWVKGRFLTAGWVQCCLHGIIKEGKGLLIWGAGHVSVPNSKLDRVVYTESLRG